MPRPSLPVPPSRGRAIAGLIVAAVAGAACDAEPPLAPPLGYETGDAACADGFDDDADGLVDCADPDCLTTSGRCGPVVPLVPLDPAIEGPVRLAPGGAVVRAWLLAVCTDRIDNDRDGRFDCGDPGCSDVPELCCGREADAGACANGLDDDADGFVDCDDHGCGATTPCAPLREPPEREPGVGDPASAEDSLERCRDGSDNDGDGYVDCADFDCSRSDTAAIRAQCAGAEEGDPAACTDGIDNDGDGTVDCADRSCRRPDDPLLGPVCSESAPERIGQWIVMPDERCADGIDNDLDGFTDCADWDCSFDERVTVCPGKPADRCGPRELDPPASCARADGERVCP